MRKILSLKSIVNCDDGCRYIEVQLYYISFITKLHNIYSEAFDSFQNAQCWAPIRQQEKKKKSDNVCKFHRNESS